MVGQKLCCQLTTTNLISGLLILLDSVLLKHSWYFSLSQRFYCRFIVQKITEKLSLGFHVCSSGICRYLISIIIPIHHHNHKNLEFKQFLVEFCLCLFTRSAQVCVCHSPDYSFLLHRRLHSCKFPSVEQQNKF